MKVSPRLCLALAGGATILVAAEYNPLQDKNRPIATTASVPPAEAIRKMTVPPGFSVQVVAAEPEVVQPVAFTIDDRGRLWVVENTNYPDCPGTPKDKILIFEDTTGDGVFDTSKIFIEGLNLVSGMEVGFGGVYVGAAPYLMFIPDRDGDDVPDTQASGRASALRENATGAGVKDRNADRKSVV